jgi:hypothetical protein
MRPQTPMPVRQQGGWFEIVFFFAWIFGIAYGADTFGWKGGVAAGIGVPVLVFGAIYLLFDKK